jgi:hypothetical protein
MAKIRGTSELPMATIEGRAGPALLSAYQANYKIDWANEEPYICVRLGSHTPDLSKHSFLEQRMTVFWH